MKKLWLIVLSLSLIVSAFCIFYVVVGAAAEPYEKEYTFPEEMSAEREALLRYLEMRGEWGARAADVLSMKDAPLRFSLYAPEYEGGWGMYTIEYTVKDAYLSDSIPESIDPEKFAERSFYKEGKLSEGYTFLLIDVIIENKSTKKQMYPVNSIEAGAGMLGFSGQTYKNTALFHKELCPGEPFEATLVYAVEKDQAESGQIYINNFGVGAADGSCVYIDTEVGN